MPGDRRWRRTALTRADGSLVEDDWSLIDEQLGAVARLYTVTGGPKDRQWFWSVLIDEHGRPWNGGTGYCDTGREAREAVEAALQGGLSRARVGSAKRSIW